MRDHIAACQPGSVLDVGPGVGTYARLLRPHLPGCRFDAVEIFEPYVANYCLNRLYDRVVVGDIRDHDWKPVDVVIFGDVLEHLRFEDAVKVWNTAREHVRLAAFVSLPVIEYPQGALEGNVHETHLHTWSHELVLAELSGITDWATYTQIGVYEASPA
jgi:hypothetical protein